ncbi:hypothetical protein B0T25DRAFT_455669 [Lasiosphaeria hispida]|uniref:Aminoglycoside phosphotransferase domain-containing protein n=1 Tax=Lasiosphaeria hispida TaxID=260671 RepID=A0AAJ0MEY5_9PEZI|nr:hypothetical protein B0T25DRAFT_455669 [Lasiosphaeria hispida]
MPPSSSTFGPLLSIPDDSLFRLAAAVRLGELNNYTCPSSVPEYRYVRQHYGSFSVVYIVRLNRAFRAVIRIPVTGWGDGWTPVAVRAMESQVATLRLLKLHTEIPIPEVYSYDTTINNAIGAPYICMSFIPGRDLGDVWFDPDLPTPLEERRVRAMKAIARSCAELAELGSFPKIGSLFMDGQEATVGPCYHWSSEGNNKWRVVESGPYDTAHAYFKDHYVPSSSEDTENWGNAKERVIRQTVLPLFPSGRSSGGFVLSHPDLDRQNIKLNDDGSLSGIIDWDLAHTQPPCVGYCKYPFFITRDWYEPNRSPEQDLRDEVDTNSPRELQRFRMQYNHAMGQAMNGADGCEFTKKSHIWEAFMRASASYMCHWPVVCIKLLQEATHLDNFQDATSLLSNIGWGGADWQMIKGQLEDYLARD